MEVDHVFTGHSEATIGGDLSWFVKPTIDRRLHRRFSDSGDSHKAFFPALAVTSCAIRSHATKRGIG
ncbi:hypothetical protein C449_03701 [Halococcus saccharolyticus DSM 5350]|uniref:Uncharacterized protein n=1 Tax=Halococcus saccharolyticus DSM 5350 TaxID=1227455 RepID=M0MQI1_9EURY|nr:hypothetical protein C449_03701 [Halococcus saccharolyticus DSM 5350]